MTPLESVCRLRGAGGTSLAAIAEAHAVERRMALKDA